MKREYPDVCRNVSQMDVQQPVVYSPMYNISFFGLEKVHPFDAAKFRKIVSALRKQDVLAQVRL